MGTTRIVAADRDPLQTVALFFGGVFLLVGILGFVPGIVSDHDTLDLAGADSHAKLLGVFQVSVLHNIVHLLFGVAGIAMARTVSTAKAFLIYGGIIYLALWVYGLVIDKASSANFVPVNSADNWLHLALGAALLGAGLALQRRPDRVR